MRERGTSVTLKCNDSCRVYPVAFLSYARITFLFVKHMTKIFDLVRRMSLQRTEVGRIRLEEVSYGKDGNEVFGVENVVLVWRSLD